MWAKSKFRGQRALLFSVIFCFLLSSQGFAKVLRVEVKLRQPVLDNRKQKITENSRVLRLRKLLFGRMILPPIIL